MNNEVSGTLLKMNRELDENNLVNYFMNFRNQPDLKLRLNDLIGETIELSHTGQKNCISCERKINKTFNQGYCYPCLQKLAECDVCIVKPELCHFDQGTCRDDEFAKKYCQIDHVIYLSITSGLKVGITRNNQRIGRWIDQGAVQAIPLIKVRRRKDAGLVEINLAELVADKTNWRKMLKNDYPQDLDLHEIKEKLLKVLSKEEKLGEIFYLSEAIEEAAEDNQIQNITYPQVAELNKISSYNFDKTTVFADKLIGIKGQYLKFTSGVINLRKFAGYQVKLSF
jgi:hypothetical protein